jgi:hypothetical protein
MEDEHADIVAYQRLYKIAGRRNRYSHRNQQVSSSILLIGSRKNEGLGDHSLTLRFCTVVSSHNYPIFENAMAI